MAARFGLGLAALGRPGYINLGHAEDLNANYAIGAMRKHAHSVFDAAWELGVRYFDAARSYGRAEEFLASWLEERDIDPDAIEVGSKWGYTYTAAWKVQTPEGIAHEIKRHELKVLQSQFQSSVNLLRSHLGLYQIHSATLQSGVLENQDVLRCLEGLRKAGIKIGLTVSGVDQPQTIDRALEIRFDDKPLFSCLQATWNVLETSATETLQRAHRAGLSIIIKEALANGRLTTRNDSESFSDTRKELEAIAKENDSTIDAICLAAALNQPWVTTVLSGAANVDHLRSNLKAADVQWSRAIQNRLSGLAQTPEVYWSQRAALAWN